MNSIAYNIPISLFEAYRGRKVIVRAVDSFELVEKITDRDLGDILYVKILSSAADVDALANWGFSVPVDVVLDNPATDFPKLYRYAKLLDKHPVRISMPVSAGFDKAVKVAAALNFAIRLEPAQPEPEVMGELVEVLDFFLHHLSVTQPIEFFHSSLMSFYDEQARTLWEIQEEDPSLFRFVTDVGIETGSWRLAATTSADASSLDDIQKDLLAERGECNGCEFWAQCGGYFKWPRREFECEGVKQILHTLRAAADELRKDVATFSERIDGSIVAESE